MRRYRTQYVNTNCEANTLPSAAQTVIYVFIFVFVGRSATPWAIQCPTSSLSMQSEGGAGREGEETKQFAWPTTAYNTWMMQKAEEWLKKFGYMHKIPFLRLFNILFLSGKSLCISVAAFRFARHTENTHKTIAHPKWVAGMACSMKTINDYFFFSVFCFRCRHKLILWGDVFRRLLVFGNKMKYLFWREKKWEDTEK